MNVETANRLMQMRKKAGLSQEELADKLGVSRQAVSKWECAESSPDTDNLIALSKIYGVTLDELINGKEDQEEPKKDSNEEFIHIKGKDGEVKIGKVHINIQDDDGSQVHVTSDGVEIIDGDKRKKDDDDDDDDEKYYRDIKVLRRTEIAIESSLPVLVTIAYLLCGFLIPNGEGWRNYWVLFFLIPVIPSIFKAIRKKKPSRFVYPVAIAMVYFSIGMFVGVWHPTWIMFITIPVYYTACHALERNYK